MYSNKLTLQTPITPFIEHPIFVCILNLQIVNNPVIEIRKILDIIFMGSFCITLAKGQFVVHVKLFKEG